MADSIDLESMTIEDKYDGPKLENGTEVTKEFVDQLLEHYKNQKLLHRRYAFQILLDARTYLMSQPSLVNVTVSYFMFIIHSLIRGGSYTKLLRRS